MWNIQRELTGRTEATFMDAPAKYSSVFDFAARVSLYFCRDFLTAKLKTRHLRDNR